MSLGSRALGEAGEALQASRKREEEIKLVPGAVTFPDELEIDDKLLKVTYTSQHQGEIQIKGGEILVHDGTTFHPIAPRIKSLREIESELFSIHPDLKVPARIQTALEDYFEGEGRKEVLNGSTQG